MDAQELTIKTIKADCPDDPSIVSFTFRVVDGAFSVTESWRSHDEIYAAGLCIYVPPRIWKQALPWIIENSEKAKRRLSGS